MPFRALIASVKSGGLFLSAITWGVLEIKFLPPPGKIYLLGIAIFLDLLSGVVRSVKQDKKVTAKGFLQTGLKVLTYCCIIFGAALLVNVMGGIYPPIDYGFFVNLTLGFLTFIEIYSIFENIYEMDRKGMLAIYLIGPFLRWIKGYLKKNNPVGKLPGQSQDETEG